MKLKEGDVFLVKAGGVVPPGSHMFVVFLIHQDEVFFSNLTDIENEFQLACVLCPADEPDIIKIKSTLRYQDIRQHPLAKAASAFGNKENFLFRGTLSGASVQKIQDGIFKAQNIKHGLKQSLMKALKSRN